MNPWIYLDNNAGTSIDPIVIQAMIKELNEAPGNPSSVHSHGKKAKQRLEQSREKIARYLKVKPNEIIFTSGGSEGANLLLDGFFFQNPMPCHVITSVCEHACVYESLKRLQNRGYSVDFLMPGLWGAVKPEDVEKALTPTTKMICLMAANNETGVKTDIEKIAQIAQRENIALIVDGVSLIGKEEFSIPNGVSAMFFSGHKFHAPKGIGFVFCRTSFKISPLFLGGNQEFNRRGGTENLPGIIGLAAAIDILQENQNRFTSHMQTLRDKFENSLRSNLKNIIINGQGPRIANTSNISFLGIDGEELLIQLDLRGLSVSHGSACSSGGLEPSRILLNMGLTPSQAASAIRFSLSRLTTEKDLDLAIQTIIHVVQNKTSGTPQG